MIKNLRKKVLELRRGFRVCPAEFALLQYMIGETPVLLRWNYSLWFVLAGIACGLAVCGRRIHLWLLPMLLGLSLCYLHDKAPWDAYRRQLPREDCSASIRGRMLSFRNATATSWNCELEIQELRLYNGEMRPSRGRVLAYFPSDVPYAYGAECRIDGAFLAFNDDFSKNYNRCLGLHSRFIARYVYDTEQPTAWHYRFWAQILRLREFLSAKLTEHIENEDAAGIYTAMIFGIRGGLRSEVRDNFVKSSTVHLFSISGLHIGLMSLCLGMLVRLLCIPLRMRLPLVCFALGLYVTLSGGAPSALRAWLMLFLILVSQNCYRIHSSENTLGVAGLFLLMVNPLFLLHTGFLFSFLLVYVLLKATHFCNDFIHTICEKRKWLPRKSWASFCLRRYSTLLAAISGSFFAWLGCNGIMMYANCLVSLGSIFVNCVIGPAAFILVAAAIPKICASLFCPTLSLFLGKILQGILSFLLLASETAAQKSLYCAGMQVPLGYSLTYCFVLWLLLSKLKLGWVRPICLAILLLLTGLYFSLGQHKDFVLACGSEDGGQGCIAYCDAPHHAWIVQAGAKDAAKHMLNELRRRGHADNIDLLISNPSDIQAAKCLMYNRQGTLCPATPPPTNKRIQELLHNAQYEGWNIYETPPQLPVSVKSVSPGEELLSFRGKNEYLKCGVNQKIIYMR